MELSTIDGAGVLIESDWNLKDKRPTARIRTENVLIESDWNLKHLKLSHPKISGKFRY